ncbi:MAG TPA: hypothetical protein VG326_14820 [Tepidisphaeraceae bacterium]|nr:hypothetical protein [Tepidisphaeraceae bacterium]
MDDSGDSNRKPAFPWMVGAAAVQSQKPAPKRRQTLAEMLRSSELAGSTVALHEAVEAAQEAAARKAEAAESPAPAEAVAAPAEAAPTALPAAVAEAPASAAASVRDREPSNGGNRYHLYAKVNGIWVWQLTVDAPGHGEGLSQVVARLTSNHEGLPIRLEQDDALATE